MSKKIELLFRDGMNIKINEIKEENKEAKFYSISKINNYNTCPRQYYHTYIDKKEQKAGIYGILGSSAHETLEDLYNGVDKSLNKNKFNNEWIKCEMFGIKFPPSKVKDSIKNNYRKDLDNFYDNYSKMEGKFISELGFIFKVAENKYLMGYIDLIRFNEDETVDIIDFKTSAMFKGSKLLESGRQLCVYEMALEQLYGLKTKNNYWQMLKYFDVKIGDNKPKILSTRSWVSDSEKQIKKLMISEKVDSSIIDLLLLQAINSNSIINLPKNVRDKISFNTCNLYYEVTEGIKEETTKYILDTIKKVESIEATEKLWEVNPNDFFCKNLCGFYPKYCNSKNK